MKKIFIFGLIAVVFSVSLAAHAKVSEADKLARIAEQYFQDTLSLNPLTGTRITAEPKYEDKLEISISPAYRAKTSALYKRVQRELKLLKVAALTPADRMTYDLLAEEVRDGLEGMRFPSELMPVDQYGGTPVYVAQFGSGEQIQPLKTVANYRNYLRRLLVLPQWTAQAEINMREGMRRGIVPPQALLSSGLPAFKALAEGNIEKSPFYTAIQVMPATFSATDKAALTQEYQRAIKTKLQPAMSAFYTFLEKTYLPATRKSSGIDAIPGGKEWYAYAVRQYTTTKMTPDEIHALGIKEVARIRSEMEKIRQHYQYQGSIAEFLKWADEDAQFRPFKTDQEVINAYQALNEKIKPKLSALFGRAPKALLEIRLEPELTRATASDHYSSPAADGSRPGVFYAVVMDPTKYSTLLMTTLFLHEGQPGHHYHLALQQELTLPNFRRYGGLTAFNEGWALYAETLGHEMGLYQDKHALLGHLSDELLRAVRLVTDTGLHSKGWTREASIKYMMEMQGYSALESRRATERYMAWPGQALAYKIGSLKIQELRARAESKLGAKFSLKEYHDLVLSDGAVPLTLLEKKVDAWLVTR